jgi:transposase-like protein
VNSQKTAITVEQIRAIKDAPATEKACDTARRLGITPHLAYYWVDKFRKAAGVNVNPTPAKPAATQIVKLHVHAKPIAAEKTATPAPQDGQVVEVTLRLTEGTLDSWWSKLPLNDKATIMGGNYDSKLDNIPLLGTVG